MEKRSDTIPTRLLLLVDQLRSGPVPEDTLETALVEEGLEAGIVVRVPKVTPAQVSLTARGLEAAEHMRADGELIFGIDITPTGLRIKGDLSRDQVVFLFQRLRLVKQTYHMALADVIAYARREHGQEFVDESLEQLHFEFMDVQKADYIGKVPLLTRETYRLDSEVAYVLGQKFPDDTASQERWARLAVEHKLSALSLKRSIDAGRIMTEVRIERESGRDSGIVVINGMFTVGFNRWVKQVGGERKILEMYRETKEEFLAETQPVVELAEKVRQSLEGEGSD